MSCLSPSSDITQKFLSVLFLCILDALLFNFYSGVSLNKQFLELSLRNRNLIANLGFLLTDIDLFELRSHSRSLPEKKKRKQLREVHHFRLGSHEDEETDCTNKHDLDTRIVSFYDY